MKSDKLYQVIQIAELKYQKDQAKMQACQKREQQLRQKLAQLSDEEKKTDKQVPQTGPFSRSGAILKWQSWVSKTRNQLNMELARTLASKEYLRQNLVKSFGQKEALAILRAKADMQKRRLEQRREL